MSKLAKLHMRKGSIYKAVVEATVIEDVDVIVAGGGTAGVVAAIAAARGGAKTLLVERRGYLGGMMTAGNTGLTQYVVHEENTQRHEQVISTLRSDAASVQVVGGIPMEITTRLIKKKAAIGTHGKAGNYVFTAAEDFKLELLTMMEEAGVKLLLHSLLVDVVNRENCAEGIVVENKAGRQVVLAKTFVDATGDGDLAARAGAPFVVGVAEGDISANHGIRVGSLQPMGVMFRIGNMDMPRCLEFLREHPEHFAAQRIAKMDIDHVRDSVDRGDMAVFCVKGLAGTQPEQKGKNRGIQFYNTPLPGVFTCCCPMAKGNGLHPKDITAAEITMAKMVHEWIREMRQSIPGCEHIYLLDRPEIGVRETRHFRGEYVLNIEDILTQRQFEDSIGKGSHAIDVSPLPKHLEKVKLPDRWSFGIPYRSLVPLQVENVLLAGRCISCTHEASGCIRPTVQCMVTGQAAGTAAAMCALGKTMPRNLNVDNLRTKLAEDGGLV